MAETLLELKQKQFTNIFLELPKGLTMNKFFQVTKTMGLTGDQVHFVLVSLDFQGESLQGVGELTSLPASQPVASPPLAQASYPSQQHQQKTSATLDSFHGNLN